MEKREGASRSRGYDLNQDFPDQKGWLEMCSPKEEADFIANSKPSGNKKPSSSDSSSDKNEKQGFFGKLF